MIIGSCGSTDAYDERKYDQNSVCYFDDSQLSATRLREFARQLVNEHRARILSFAEQLVALDELGELVAR
jgi:hypothetical protein